MASLPGAGQQFLPPVALGVVSEMTWGENGAVPPLWKGVRLKEGLQTLPLTLLLPTPYASCGIYTSASRSAFPNLHQPHWAYQSPHEGPRPGGAGRDVGTLQHGSPKVPPHSDGTQPQVAAAQPAWKSENRKHGGEQKWPEPHLLVSHLPMH